MTKLSDTSMKKLEEVLRQVVMFKEVDAIGRQYAVDLLREIECAHSPA